MDFEVTEAAYKQNKIKQKKTCTQSQVPKAFREVQCNGAL